MNPLRSHDVRMMGGTVIAVITHLPELVGYHKYRLEVVKLCITSAIQNAGEHAWVLVWDNGSCEELTSWLREQDLDYLMLSPNIGKSSARAAIMRMFPGNTMVALSDDDIFFYPGWLTKSFDVFDTFPDVGVVSCMPLRTHFRWGCENTVKWARKDPDAVYDSGNFMPEKWHKEVAANLGINPKVYLKEMEGELDHVATYDGVTAYLTGHHAQFLGMSGVLAKFVRHSREAMADEKPFDIAIDNGGYLRLSTIERLALHIGNVIDPFIREEAEKYGLC